MIAIPEWVYMSGTPHSTRPQKQTLLKIPNFRVNFDGFGFQRVGWAQ